MTVPSEPSSTFASGVGRQASILACALFALSVLLGAGLHRSLPLAVYALSFWHYYLYWLAFAFGVPSFDVFKRDAVALKAASVAVLTAVYLAQPLDSVSLAVIAGGILLNARAASVLGIDRTYYGHEVAGLPPQRVTAFPYSLTGHPMILGNIAAFGGTLLNPAFRENWWPLAGLHVALNIGLLVMELAGRRRTVRIGGGLVFAAVLAGAAIAILRADPSSSSWVAALAVAALACAAALHRCYAPSTIRRSS